MADLSSLPQLRRLIERQLDWPAPTEWSAAHFDELAEHIAAATEVRLSATTLKRVWGRVNHRGNPSRTTLDALARYAGFTGWVDFVAARAKPAVEPVATTKKSVPVTPAPARRRWWITGALLLTGLFIAAAILRPYPTAAPTVERFSFDPVTTGLPNTVQFRYALSGHYDSVEIQQSWDERLRYRVAPDNGFHASTYYYPGVYQAKLVVDGAVAEERTLVVPSVGWLGTRGTDKASVPTYLSPDSIRLADGGLRIAPTAPATVQELHYVPAAPLTTTTDLQLRTRFRSAPDRVCGRAELLLLAENGVLILPFAAPGCTGELRLFASGREWSGRDHDLSAFGIAPNAEVDVEVRLRADSVRVRRAGKPVFADTLPRSLGPVRGLRYRFEGGGQVLEATADGRNLLSDQQPMRSTQLIDKQQLTKTEQD